MNLILKIGLTCCVVVWPVYGADQFRAPLEEPDITVAPGLSYHQQVISHLEIVKKFKIASEACEVEAKAAEEADSYKRMRNVNSEAKRLNTYWEPYKTAKLRADDLKSNSYLLQNKATGQVCNTTGQCSQVDPVVALFMIFLDAVAGELNKEKPFDPTTNDLVKFLIKPAGDNSDFVKIRSILIPQDDQGEIARILRDPVNRPIEAIQNIRDSIVPPSETGDGAKILRDPIKAPVQSITNAVQCLFGCK